MNTVRMICALAIGVPIGILSAFVTGPGALLVMLVVTAAAYKALGGD